MSVKIGKKLIAGHLIPDLSDLYNDINNKLDKTVDVVQTVGTAANKVMSQNATTDAIEEAVSKVKQGHEIVDQNNDVVEAKTKLKINGGVVFNTADTTVVRVMGTQDFFNEVEEVAFPNRTVSARDADSSSSSVIKQLVDKDGLSFNPVTRAEAVFVEDKKLAEVLQDKSDSYNTIEDLGIEALTFTGINYTGATLTFNASVVAPDPDQFPISSLPPQFSIMFNGSTDTLGSYLAIHDTFGKIALYINGILFREIYNAPNFSDTVLVFPKDGHGNDLIATSIVRLATLTQSTPFLNSINFENLDKWCISFSKPIKASCKDVYENKSNVYKINEVDYISLEDIEIGEDLKGKTLRFDTKVATPTDTTLNKFIGFTNGNFLGNCFQTSGLYSYGIGDGNLTAINVVQFIKDDTWLITDYTFPRDAHWIVNYKNDSYLANHKEVITKTKILKRHLTTIDARYLYKNVLRYKKTISLSDFKIGDNLRGKTFKFDIQNSPALFNGVTYTFSNGYFLGGIEFSVINVTYVGLLKIGLEDLGGIATCWAAGRAGGSDKWMFTEFTFPDDEDWIIVSAPKDPNGNNFCSRVSCDIDMSISNAITTLMDLSKDTQYIASGVETTIGIDSQDYFERYSHIDILGTKLTGTCLYVDSTTGETSVPIPEDTIKITLMIGLVTATITNQSMPFISSVIFTGTTTTAVVNKYIGYITVTAGKLSFPFMASEGDIESDGGLTIIKHRRPMNLT